MNLLCVVLAIQLGSGIALGLDVLRSRCQHRDYDKTYPDLMTAPGGRTSCAYFKGRDEYLAIRVTVDERRGINVSIEDLGYYDAERIQCGRGNVSQCLTLRHVAIPGMSGAVQYYANGDYERSMECLNAPAGCPPPANAAKLRYVAIQDCLSGGEAGEKLIEFRTDCLKPDDLTAIRSKFGIDVNKAALKACFQRKDTVFPSPRRNPIQIGGSACT